MISAKPVSVSHNRIHLNKFDYSIVFSKIDVTHRLAGLDMADEILVLQAGKIKERGKHHDLLQAEGLYWKLWQLQNQVIDPSRLT